MRKILTVLVIVPGLALAGCAVPEDPTPVQPAEQGDAGGKAKASKKAAPIGLAAKRTTAHKSMLSSGDALTCVKVTVTNRTKKQVEINPLYFAITGTDGTKHDASTALGEYDGQIDTMEIAPGEKAKGTVCVKGNFKPKTVSMTNPIFDTAARAEVA